MRESGWAFPHRAAKVLSKGAAYGKKKALEGGGDTNLVEGMQWGPLAAGCKQASGTCLLPVPTGADKITWDQATRTGYQVAQ